MNYITADKILTPYGFQDDIQIGITPEGKIGYLGPQQNVKSTKVSLLLPAPVNLHSHTFQRAMAGLTEKRGPRIGDNFWTWRKLMYRFLDQLNPDQIESIATLAFMEMLEAGYASVVEFHYLHHAQDGKLYSQIAETSERIIAAAKTTGIGLTLLPVLYQFAGCDKRPLQGGQRRFGNDPDQFLKLFEGAESALKHSFVDNRIGVAPHSLRAVDAAGLDELVHAFPGGPIHMHLAEQVAEVEEFEAHIGARPTQWLLDNYDVDQRWTLIHCTQMDEQETNRLAKSGAVAGLCPITESNLGDGVFNGTQFLGAGGKIGFGSDSNVHISLFDELKTLEYSQRLRDRSRAALAIESQSTGRTLFEHSLVGGAQAANRDTGKIEIGMLADFIAIESDNQWLCNRNNDDLLDSLIFGGFGHSCITDIWSAGRHVVKNGHHREREKIIRDYKKTICELKTDI